jgi:hypothetical protein
MQRLFTLAFMTCRLQRPIGALESAIRELKIEPALSLNDVAYYADGDERRIDEHLREIQIRQIRERPKPA